MRNALTVGLVIGTLTLVPAAGFAQAQTYKKPASSSQAKPAATHAANGVVKSFTDSTLVVTKSGRRGGEVEFTLNPATHREGTLAVGAPVSVRYRDDGTIHVATAVTAKPVKQQAAHPKKA